MVGGMRRCETGTLGPVIDENANALCHTWIIAGTQAKKMIFYDIAADNVGEVYRDARTQYPPECFTFKIKNGECKQKKVQWPPGIPITHVKHEGVNEIIVPAATVN